MSIVEELVRYLREALEDPARLPEVISSFQKQVWKDRSTDSPKFDYLRDLAYDLDFYEPDPIKRKEDPSFFGDQRALEEIRQAIAAVEGRSPHAGETDE